MDEERKKVPLRRTHCFPASARAAYSHLTGQLGPPGLKQGLLQVLPSAVRSCGKQANAPDGDFLSLFWFSKTYKSLTLELRSVPGFLILMSY